MIESPPVALPNESEVRRLFLEDASRLSIPDPEARIRELVIYEMTDGTRTSSELGGDDAYVDGGVFCLRLIEICRVLGVQNLYVNVIHTRHKLRSNYQDIYRALVRLVSMYSSYATAKKVTLRFLGNREERLNPQSGHESDLQNELTRLEKVTTTPGGLSVYFLVNYSTKWDAASLHDESLPKANVIVRHTKGYVNGDMWLFGKLDDNTFVYVQNGSSSKNWSDAQLVWLIALALRSKFANEGTHYSMDYTGDTKSRIREDREENLDMRHVQLTNDPSKRVVLFSPTGPEIYEF